MAINTSTTLGGGTYTSIAGGSLDMAPIYLRKKLLHYITKTLVFDKFADKEPLPEGNGKAMRFTRYPRVGLPFVPATEGVTPTDLRELAPEVVEAFVDQWIDIGEVSDVAEMTIAHKPLQQLLERMGIAAGELIDREYQRVLNAGGTVVYTDPNYSARSDITVNDVLTPDTIGRVVSRMRDDGVPDVDGMYIGIYDWFTDQDLFKDQVFATTSTYQMKEQQFKGMLSRNWLGVRWYPTNHIPVLQRNATLSAVSPTSPADAANTLLADIDIKLTGLTMFGFETAITPVLTQTGSWAANDVMQVVIPSVPGFTRYNIYAGPVGGTLRKQNSIPLAAGTYVITGTGATSLSATPILYTTSSTMDIAPVTPASNVKVHRTYILGKEAYGNIELDPVDVLITPRVPSDTDPAMQRRKVSYKLMNKAVVKNSNYFRVIEHESEFD